MPIIVKYYTNALGMVNIVFEEITDPRKRGKVLTKENARERIEELGLVKVHKDESGVIWDTPNKEFYNSFKGMSNEIKEF